MYFILTVENSMVVKVLNLFTVSWAGWCAEVTEQVLQIFCTIVHTGISKPLVLLSVARSSISDP